jgi:hypothetical protein
VRHGRHTVGIGKAEALPRLGMAATDPLGTLQRGSTVVTRTDVAGPWRLHERQPKVNGETVRRLVGARHGPEPR